MDLKVIKEFKLPEQIFDARYHPTSDFIAVSTISGNVHLVEDGQTRAKISKHHKGSAIRKVRFDTDGRMVTIAKTVKVHDLDSDETLHTLRRSDTKSTTFYSVLPLANNIICAGDDDGGLFVWDTRAPNKPTFFSKDCEQYISDIDGKFESRRLIVCTSGEGTLTAYDLRANKKIEPQSELFETGFQCVKMVDKNKKVVIGGEDGSIYVFNHNEWAHTSGKFSIDEDAQNRGKCSIDGIEMIPDTSIFIAICSDGRARLFTLWPHEIINEYTLCKRKSLESIHINPREGVSEVVVSGENYINIVSFEDEDTDEDSKKSGSASESEEAPAADDSKKSCKKRQLRSDQEPEVKRIGLVKDDYLNLFN